MPADPIAAYRPIGRIEQIVRDRARLGTWVLHHDYHDVSSSDRQDVGSVIHAIHSLRLLSSSG